MYDTCVCEHACQQVAHTIAKVTFWQALTHSLTSPLSTHDYSQTSFFRPHPFTFALKSLLEQSKEQYPTIVTEHTRSTVSFYRQDMRADHLIKLLLGVSWRKKRKIGFLIRTARTQGQGQGWQADNLNASNHGNNVPHRAGLNSIKLAAKISLEAML